MPDEENPVIDNQRRQYTEKQEFDEADAETFSTESVGIEDTATATQYTQKIINGRLYVEIEGQ